MIDRKDRGYFNRTVILLVLVEYLDLIFFLFIDCFSVNNNFILVIYSFNSNPIYYSKWFPFVSNLHLTLLIRGHASSLCSLLTDKMRWSDTCSTCPKANFPLLHHSRLVWWPTTVTAKPKTSQQKQNTSRQNQKPHGKNKIIHTILTTREIIRLILQRP